MTNTNTNTNTNTEQLPAAGKPFHCKGCGTRVKTGQPVRAVRTRAQGWHEAYVHGRNPLYYYCGACKVEG